MNQFTKTDLNQTLYVKKDIVDKSRKRYQIDATGLTLGRLAVVVTNHLVGKGKVTNCDFWDSGDFVVVHNVDKMVYTGNKGINKEYHTYSGYKGHVKSIRLQDLMKKDPSKVLRYAIKGMLPKNKLGRAQLKKLKVYAGSEHEHAAQKPEVLNIK